MRPHRTGLGHRAARRAVLLGTAGTPPRRSHTMSATITLDELRSAIDSGDITVVDTLGPIYFEASHIPGAINIPHTEVRALAPQLLPDLDAPVVTYCSNEACRNS